MLEEMEGTTTKPPQISDMFTKFAHVVRTKTFELFNDDEENNNTDTTNDVFTLLNSTEEFITDQKVVVIKPDFQKYPQLTNTHFTKSLISSLFATMSSFEASYLQLQTAHVPFDENALESADKVLVSVLQKLTEMKNLYKEFRRNPSCNIDVLVGSELEFQVQEHQSKLRVLETMVNQLLSYMESKDDEVSILKKKLDKLQDFNLGLSRKLGVKNEKLNNSSTEILCTVRVFESMLRDSIKSANKFTKLLMELMKRAGWDLEKAANSAYSDVSYAEKEHHKYAFLSYICLGMFKGFDLEDYGLCDEEVSGENDYLKQLLEHVSCNPMEILSINPSCAFSRFCEKKYEQIIHPTIESSIFRNLEGKEVIVDSWKSLSVFYELFVRMASTIWLLHKLAYSFNPIVEIFQVERGVDFSMVYMEDVTRKSQFPLSKTRPKVGFTVVPGFKIGRTVIQTQVYLTALKSKE
ncbi:protein GRAVITROPIC IN THE LIGHT 1 [Lycium barbarum]|uniref:protein GRAVITROPIC IN THE LIGHT 1 n=1 Tax=Lycium barbarum TaxID=112863 RepID=UPI00293E9184|nr:protein GRAVITROPIC IN THE LIGHT 1 [Lycium barbarum]